MSWFKFWSKSKSKSKDIEEYQKEFKRAESLRENSTLTDAEREKQRLKHSLSISRSGRFKQKKRERGGILDKPEMFGQKDNSGRPNMSPPEPPSGHSRSPSNTCRDVRQVFQSSMPSQAAAV